ncbi:MAG: VPLPA-CTERM sorting domain-containing protein [Chromatiales bacterium]|nr:VPLPA-CTERM sorting domain-containing protein [Chromatiales bacterium]
MSGPTFSKRLLAAVVLSAATILGAPAASADTVSCGDLAGYGGSSPSFPDGRIRLGTPCFQSVTPANGGLIIAEADADRGIIRAASTVQLPSGVSHLSQSGAAWEEQYWAINHPDPAQQGTNGVLRFAFFVEGYLDATGAGQSSVLLQATSLRSPNPVTLFTTFANGTTGPKSVLAFVEGALSFRFGETSNFNFSLTTRAERAPGASGEGFAEAVFNNTIYWGGLAAVEDSLGNAVSGFSFSGFNAGLDFTESQVPTVVPLPASAWLLGTGIAGLLWRRRQGLLRPGTASATGGNQFLRR